MRLLGSKYAKTAFAAGATGGAHSAPPERSPDPLAGFWGRFTAGDGKERGGKGKGREKTGRERRGGERKERNGKGEKGRGREGRRGDGRGRGGPLKLRIPGSFYYPSPPLCEIGIRN